MLATAIKERDLLEPVLFSLRSQGFSAQSSEVEFFDYRMDIFAYAESSDTSIAVELKLDRWKRALEQALIYQLCADLSYIALPERKASSVDIELLGHHGVGLLSISSRGSCEIILPAKKTDQLIANFRTYYIELLGEGRA